MSKSSMIFMLIFFLAAPAGGRAADTSSEIIDGIIDRDDALNLHCLRKSYPQIIGAFQGPVNGIWLELANGEKIPYVGSGKNGRDADLKNSMAQIYPLEPQRPDSQPGFAPGRQRPYAFFNALYGSDKPSVKANLVNTKMFGKNVALSPDAALALASAIPQLEKLVAKNPELKKYLAPEGGFYWRNIAGEDTLSAHSYGIALDVGIKKSPYWRWSKVMPHPAQKSWPAEIVKIMEDNGFIWGGKWREYDLMHFEYRPELICKAQMLEKGIPPAISHAGENSPVNP